MTGPQSRTESPMIVVTGLPRTGTSMMMRLLEAGGVPVIVDGVRKPDLDNPNGYYEYEPVKTLKQDSSWVPRSQGKAVKLVYLLLRDLPPHLPYDVIFMRRDMSEVVASQDEMLRRKGNDVSQHESHRLIEMFRKELAAIETWLTARANFRVLYVDYNRTILEPQEACARVKAFLNLDLNENRMTAVVSKALYRQRRLSSDEHFGRPLSIEYGGQQVD